MYLNQNILEETLRKKGYQCFGKLFELNIIGVRSQSPEPNTFQDKLAVFFKDNDLQDHFFQYSITTDPDTYWLEHPMRPEGAAILVPDQYLNGWHIREHRNEYLCLGQYKPVKVYRDNQRNGKLVFDKTTIEEGLFEIEIHKGADKPVSQWSAGCQVFQSGSDFDEFMGMCEQHKSYYGNVFTYTLLDQVDLVC